MDNNQNNNQHNNQNNNDNWKGGAIFGAIIGLFVTICLIIMSGESNALSFIFFAAIIFIFVFGIYLTKIDWK